MEGDGVTVTAGSMAASGYDLAGYGSSPHARRAARTHLVTVWRGSLLAGEHGCADFGRSSWGSRQWRCIRYLPCSIWILQGWSLPETLNKSIRPNRLWGHPEGPFGTPERHLSGSVLPWIPPERRKPLLWHLGSVSQFLGAGTPVKKSAKPQPATGMAGGDAQGALRTAGGMG